MTIKEPSENLKRARRALDALGQVEIIDDWDFDNDLNVWFLHLSIYIKKTCPYFPQMSKWYVVVEDTYPYGRIKVYPDVNDSITITNYHQSNNAKIETNGLWRKGNLCLGENTLNNGKSEPKTVDDRLLFHVQRAIYWLELTASEKLVSENELFELPDFDVSDTLDIKFCFSEDHFTFIQWEDKEISYGIAELQCYKTKPDIFYVKEFNGYESSFKIKPTWGSFLSKEQAFHTNAPWILLNSIPVINKWQPPETLGDLIYICDSQGINLMEIFKKLFPEIRDGKHHLFLVGFPVPKYFDGQSETIFWMSIKLPVVSNGSKTANGFRTNEAGWWQNDKTNILLKKMPLNWVISENWNQKEISSRGIMNECFLRKKVLLLGVGCIGSAISEILVRAGTYNITIADCDIFEVGNLTRHVLTLNDIGKLKEEALCKHLNSINPNTMVNVISDRFKFNTENVPNIELEKYDIIIDCTGNNDVIEIMEKSNFSKELTLITVSVGLGAKHMYMSLMKGKTFNFSEYAKMITPYIDQDIRDYQDIELPRDGTGCWHPTFPGRSDDIWLSATTAVKTIEKYFISNCESNISLVYEQKMDENYFESYRVVSKTEKRQDDIL